MPIGVYLEQPMQSALNLAQLLLSTNQPNFFAYVITLTYTVHGHKYLYIYFYDQLFLICFQFLKAKDFHFKN